MANRRNRRKLIPYGGSEYPQTCYPYPQPFSNAQMGYYPGFQHQMRSYQTDSNCHPSEEFTRDEFNMTNDQFHYRNVRSKQLSKQIKWQQAGATDPDVIEVSSAPQDVQPVKPQIPGAKRLMKGLSQPVEADKAQRMMARMGWQGGALGCNRDGLTEPLMPNLLLQKGAGLGHRPPAHSPPKPKLPKISKNNSKDMQISSRPVDAQTTQVTLSKSQKKQVLVKLQKQQKKEIKKKKQAVGRGVEGISKKEWKKMKLDKQGDPGRYQDFYETRGQRPKPKKMRRRVPTNLQTNILNTIFSFVSDPKQDKMAFDKSLTKTQRAYIHFLTVAFSETNGVLYDGCLDSERQAKIIDAICECNSYVLKTESMGIGEERRIYLYKEPPVHMYLITKDDFTFCPEADDKNDNGYTENDEVVTIDDDSNDSEELEYEELDDDEMCTVDEVKKEFGDEFNEKDNIIVNSEHNMILKEIKNESTFYSNNKDKTETNTEDIDTDIKVDSNRDNMVNYHPFGKEKDKIESEEITEKTAKIDSNIENIACKVIKNDPKKTETEHESIMERKERIRKLLLEYFKEFCGDTKYTEMRFLGDFDETEENAIVQFITEIGKCVDDIYYCQNLVQEGENWLEPIFCNETYKLMTMANTNGYSDNIIEKALRNNPDELNNEIIYDTSQQPYGSNKIIYETSQQPYGSNKIIYETSQQPYGSNEITYETSQQSYGSNEITYETSLQPYGSNKIIYDTSQQPYGSNEITYETSLQPYGSNKIIYDTSQQPYGSNEIIYKTSPYGLS